MDGFLEMMGAPLVMSLILVAMHSHLGWHVVRRGVIFVDIALAQVAACGAAVSLLFGGEVGSGRTYVYALAAVFLGAGLISLTRTGDRKVPQEAYIGIIYAVASAAMMIVLTGVPHGGEEVSHLLEGALLWVTWAEVVKTAILYAVLGALLWLWHKPLRRISVDADGARASGMRVGLWDLVFYLILGTVVTSSVQVAGVLLVFSLLVVPTVMAVRLLVSEVAQFPYSLAVGGLAAVIGLAVSYFLDLPSGTSIVCSFGGLLLLQVIVQAVFRR